MGSKRGEWTLFFLCLAAAGYGLALIYSATRYDPELYSMVAKQGVALAGGVTVCLVLRVLDVRRLLERLWWLLPPLNAGLLLLLVPFGNDDGTGNKSWLALPGGLFNLQPGEVVKVTFLLLLALQLQKLGEKGINRPKSVVLLLLHVLALCALVYGVSGDIGMVAVYLAIYLVMLWSAGVHPLWLLGQAGAGEGRWPSSGPGCRTMSASGSWWSLTMTWTRWAQGSSRRGACWPSAPGRSRGRGTFRGPKPRAPLPRPYLPGTRISSSPWRGRSWAWWAAWPFWPCWAPSCCGACGWPAGAGTLCSPRWPWGWRGCSAPRPF